MPVRPFRNLDSCDWVIWCIRYLLEQLEPVLGQLERHSRNVYLKPSPSQARLNQRNQNLESKLASSVQWHERNIVTPNRVNKVYVPWKIQLDMKSILWCCKVLQTCSLKTVRLTAIAAKAKDCYMAIWSCSLLCLANCRCGGLQAFGTYSYAHWDSRSAGLTDWWLPYCSWDKPEST